MYCITRYKKDRLLVNELLKPKYKATIQDVVLEESINKEKNRYKKLQTIFSNKRVEKVKDSIKLEVSRYKPVSIFIFLLIFFIFCFGTTMLYIDDVNKTINIIAAIFIIVFIPMFFTGLNLFIQIVGIIRKNSIPFLYKFTRNIDLSDEKKAIFVSYRMFFYLVLNMIFSIISFVLIFVKSAFWKYEFLIETTWLPNSFISELINLCTKALFFINPPSNELITSTMQSPNSDKTWLWFILGCILFYNILLRFCILPLTFLYSKKSLKNIFLNSLEVQEFLSIKPDILTTSKDEKYINIKHNVDTKQNIKKEKIKNIVLYKLSEVQVKNLLKNLGKIEELQDVNIIKYDRKMDTKKLSDAILIIADYSIDLKKNIVSRIYSTNKYVELSFVNSSGDFYNNLELINKWIEFFTINNMPIKVQNYG